MGPKTKYVPLRMKLLRTAMKRAAEINRGPVVSSVANVNLSGINAGTSIPKLPGCLRLIIVILR
jgi:hypothetical protein